MAAKTGINEKVANDENNRNDWQQSDDEDNWEDWDDAQDNFIDVETNGNVKEPQGKQMSQQSANQLIDKQIGNKLEDDNLNIQNNNSYRKREQQQSVESQQSCTTTWGIWSGKLTSVFSTASEGLGSITSTVNQGINQIIGLPEPEELARINATEAEMQKTKRQTFPTVEHEKPAADSAAVFGLNLVSGVTSLGSKVINTGLDTLEGIGKKTMTILQENDPKLMNKRKLLGFETEKPNLSAILQEAKKDADLMEKSLRELQLQKQKAYLCFDILFENYCGLVHYEALEILSKESNLKLQTLLDTVSGNALNELQETINEVRELLEMEELEDESDGDYDATTLNEQLLATIADVDLHINFDDIVNCWAQSVTWLSSNDAAEADVNIVFAKSITALTEACALQICKLHKIAELLLIKDHHSTASEVDAIVQLCRQFNAHLQGIVNRYAAVLNKNYDGDVVKQHVNTLCSELIVAREHIEKAYKLFVPIIQLGAA